MAISKIKVQSEEHTLEATKLVNSRTIDGISFDGTTNVTRYATCSTAAGTKAKTANVTAGSFSLATGAQVTVKFTYANTVAAPTLNINSSGAKAIYWHGAALDPSQYWSAGAVLDFVYNGSQWELIGVAGITEDGIVDALGFYPSETDTKYTMTLLDNGTLQLTEINDASTFAAEPDVEGVDPGATSYVNGYFKTIQVLRSGDIINYAPAIRFADGYTSKDSNLPWDTSTAVYGRLRIENGGTGANTAAKALQNFGLTATAEELNYCDGVTSNIQTQINNLLARIAELEAALANKQDKIYNWGDLANTADTNLVNVAEEGA